MTDADSREAVHLLYLRMYVCIKIRVVLILILYSKVSALEIYVL